MFSLLQSSNVLCVWKKKKIYRCHNLSLLNSCDDIFIIESSLIVQDKGDNNPNVIFFLARLSYLEQSVTEQKK